MNDDPLSVRETLKKKPAKAQTSDIVRTGVGGLAPSSVSEPLIQTFFTGVKTTIEK